MDLDDLEEAPSKLPSRVSKFAPKSSKLKPKPKPKPKSELQQQQPPPKPEPHPEPQPPFSKPEPQEFDLTASKTEDVDDRTVVPTTHAKPEPNGTAKMDVEPKSETEDEPTQGDSMAVDEGETAEDAVVREIDVFFTPSIDADTQLYVLQYPLRPCWRPYELDERCEEVRLKPESSRVEIDLSIDLESSNVDKEFASKVNFTKQTLATSWNPPPANGYAVGLLMGDKLHLHPIHAVVQLRPSFQHLYKRKNNVSTGANATVKVEGSIEQKSVAAPKKQNKQMESSIGQKGDGDECWVPLKYHSCKSDISSRYLQQMVTHESSPINFTMNAHDYVTALCPGVSSNILPKGPSKRHLLSLPPEERLKKLLIDDVEGPQLHRFSAIKHFAPEYSEGELLGFLQEHAILVQGLWTVKSRLQYPQNGVETLARDFVILLFNKNLKVQSSDVNLRGGLGNKVKKFLNKFGLERDDPRKSSAQPIPYWKFRELPDESFKKLYPNIVEKQEELLKSLEQQVSDACGVGKRKFGKDATVNRIVSSELVKSANSDQRVTSLGGVPLAKMTMSNETRHALPLALKKLFQTHKVCSFQMIRHGLREMAVSKSILSKGDSKILVDAAHSLDGPPDELKAVISEVACDIRGYYVLKSSPDEPFRDVVIDLLRGSSEPDAKLKKAEIYEAARRRLGREVTNSEYTKVMSELCVSRGSVWVLKSGDRSMQ